MYTLYNFHFLNGISEINQLFDDILIIWPAPVYIFKHLDYSFVFVFYESTQTRSQNRASWNFGDATK